MQIEKDNLKILIYKNLRNRIYCEYSKDIQSDEEFCFDLIDENKSIAFECTIEHVGGGSCYMDEDNDVSEYCTTMNSIKNFDQYDIKDFLENLIIQEHQLKYYGIDLSKNKEDLDLYYENYSALDNVYFYSKNEDGSNDHYHNHDVVRYMRIPLDEITEFLSTFKFTKPITEYKEMFEYINFEEDKESQSIINASLLEEILVEKEISRKKAKM